VAGASVATSAPVAGEATATAIAAPTPLAKDDRSAPAVAKREIYVVKRGDTLWGIAAKFSTTVDRLKRLNNLTGRRARGLQAGQRLAVIRES
jgi:LysM repeat protein